VAIILGQVHFTNRSTWEEESHNFSFLHFKKNVKGSIYKVIKWLSLLAPNISC